MVKLLGGINGKKRGNWDEMWVPARRRWNEPKSAVGNARGAVLMAQVDQARIHRELGQAEGYLMLGLLGRALEILESRDDWSPMRFEAAFLLGEAFRMQGRIGEALRLLEHAATLRPRDVGVAISLGWCYKRTHRLAQAIDTLDRAGRDHPEVALLRYNLACYWSLAGHAAKALDELESALELDPDFWSMLADEADFDPIRDHPEYLRLAAAPPRPN